MNHRRVVVAFGSLASLLVVGALGSACRVRTSFPVLTPVVAVPINVGPSAPPPPQQQQPQPIATGAVPAQGGPIEAGCSFNGQQLRGEVGSIFQIACPPNCQEGGGLWGTDTYTADSSICKAAIHAGAIPAAGGVVSVRIDPGRPAYRGSVHYGVRSHDYGNYRQSTTILFQEGQQRIAEAAPPPVPQTIEAGCSYNGDQIRGQVGTVATVSCPAGCDQALVWGTDVYPSFTPICTAAIHAGLITPQGGTVVVTLDSGRPAYRGSIRYGVRSRDHGEHRASFRLRRP